VADCTDGPNGWFSRRNGYAVAVVNPMKEEGPIELRMPFQMKLKRQGTFINELGNHS
jgi:hypothetical protein